MNDDLVLSVSDFVAVFNQTIEHVYAHCTISGELGNFRVSKNRWVYFDLKDEIASVKFFGTVYQLPAPLEDGMVLKVRGTPLLHPQYGFSINIENIQLAGEGSLQKAAKLLEAKLKAEGLFESARKRLVPYPPTRIGLITSGESAAYADFVKILNERWGGVDIQLYDVQVQGYDAPEQIVRAINYFNQHADGPEVLVITRGGGSSDDLQAFNTEAVTRAVAASRIPTLVAIGHEVDISLAEMAADQRASTPSNAAQLLVPDKQHELQALAGQRDLLTSSIKRSLQAARDEILRTRDQLTTAASETIKELYSAVQDSRRLLMLLNPQRILERGYAVVYHKGKLVRSVKNRKPGELLDVQLHDGKFHTTISSIKP